jgi:succinate dehydrogenase / fumarate reductase, flavoprotein subunit
MSPTRAYNFVDHTVDVVVVWVSGAGLRAIQGVVEAGLTAACGGVATSLGNLGGRQLAVAHVRHGQRV